MAKGIKVGEPVNTAEAWAFEFLKSNLPHEAARIQCFPDTYNFELSNKTTTRKNLNKWIGDAVPSMLGMYACAIALQQNLGKPLKFPWSI